MARLVSGKDPYSSVACGHSFPRSQKHKVAFGRIWFFLVSETAGGPSANTFFNFSVQIPWDSGPNKILKSVGRRSARLLSETKKNQMHQRRDPAKGPPDAAAAAMPQRDAKAYRFQGLGVLLTNQKFSDTGCW